MASVASSFCMLFVVFVLISVHEVGHFLAGMLAGIPASEMRVRLFTFPQHVAVRDGEHWCSPVANMPRYVELTCRFLTTRIAAFCYVSGGVVVEGLFALLATTLFVALDQDLLAFWTPVLSLAVLLINVVLMDVPWAIIRKHPMGDFSGLWMIAKLPTLALFALMVGIRVAMICMSSHPPNDPPGETAWRRIRGPMPIGAIRQGGAKSIMGRYGYFHL